MILETVFPVENGQASVKAQQRAYSDEEINAVSFATRLLIKNNNPNADLIVASLSVLKGHWPEEKLEASARQMAEATTTWLERTCLACNEHVGKAYSDVSIYPRHNAIMEATKELEEMFN